MARAAATPDAVVSHIAAAVLGLLRDPVVMNALAASGLDLAAMDTKEFATLVQAESKKWQKLVPISGARIE